MSAPFFSVKKSHVLFGVQMVIGEALTVGAVFARNLLSASLSRDLK
jgi:hypothetical protein